jgi:hypothetical protein
MRPSGNRREGSRPVAQKKKDQLALAQYGDNLFCYRPDPDDPGGLGAEESGVERTGPTQVFLSQFSRAVGGRKWGGIMIPLTIL